MKRILLTEWGVEPRVFGLDEFIKAQTLDAEEKALGLDDGMMLDSEVEQLNAMKIGERVRIGDTDCTEIYVERLCDSEDTQRAMTWEDGDGIAMIFTQISYLCDRLAIELPKVEDGIDICAAERAKIVAHLIDDWLIR